MNIKFKNKKMNNQKKRQINQYKINLKYNKIYKINKKMKNKKYLIYNKKSKILKKN